MLGPVRPVVALVAAYAADWQDAWRPCRRPGRGSGLGAATGLRPATRPIVVGKAKHQQPAQVDRGDPQRPPHLVALHPAVGHPSAAVSDQPASKRSTIGRQRR